MCSDGICSLKLLVFGLDWCCWGSSCFNDTFGSVINTLLHLPLWGTEWFQSDFCDARVRSVVVRPWELRQPCCRVLTAESVLIRALFLHLNPMLLSSVLRLKANSVLDALEWWGANKMLPRFFCLMSQMRRSVLTSMYKILSWSKDWLGLRVSTGVGVKCESKT